jgi:hypothetical protein
MLHSFRRPRTHFFFLLTRFSGTFFTGGTLSALVFRCALQATFFRTGGNTEISSDLFLFQVKLRKNRVGEIQINDEAKQKSPSYSVSFRNCNLC